MTGETPRPLLGRAKELAVVDRMISALASGPALLDIAGDPGQGKTRLLAEIAHRAASAGAEVTTGAVEGPGARQFQAAQSARILLVDDAHTLGPDEVRELTAVLRTSARRAVLIVLAHRPRQCPAPLLSALTGPLPGWRVESLVLGDLDTATSVEFAGTGLCGRHRDELHLVSGGNPRYMELLTAACDGPEHCDGDDDLSDRRLPARAVAPLLAEVQALGPDARSVARAAAVLGEAAGPGLLAEVAGIGPDTVPAAIDELVTADLLRPAADTGLLEFRHPLERQVVHAHLPSGWRVSAHRRAIDALRGTGHPPVRCAAHVVHAALEKDEAGAELLARAAECRMSDSPAIAARWYRSAARLLPDTPVHRPRRQAWLAGAARAAVLAGRPEQAAEALAARDLLVTGDDHFPESADAARQRAVLALRDGHVAFARDHVHAALTGRGEPGLPYGVAELWVFLAGTTSREHHQESRTWFDEAVLATAGSDDVALQAHALALHGTDRMAQGALEAARCDALAAARIADRQSDRCLAQRLELLTCLGRLEAQLEQYGPAVRHLTRGLAIALGSGQWPSATELAAELGWIFLRQGRLADAAGRAEQAVRCAGLSRSPELRATALCLRAQVALERHEPETAVAVAGAADALASAESPWRWQARLAFAAAQSAMGDPLGCHETLAAAGLDEPATAPLPLADRIRLAEVLCGAELALGRAESARRLAEWAHTTAENGAPAGLRAVTALLSAATCDDPAEALGLAEQARTDAAASGHAMDEGRARVAAARAMDRLGEPGRALRHLDLASRAADNGGWARLGVEIAGARKSVEESQAAHEVGSSFMLSPREFEISTLVSQGCTNRQIARALGVSHKTIETHLGRIFTKLEVSSRAEIANMIGRKSVIARPHQRAKAPVGTAVPSGRLMAGVS